MLEGWHHYWTKNFEFWYFQIQIVTYTIYDVYRPAEGYKTVFKYIYSIKCYSKKSAGSWWCFITPTDHGNETTSGDNKKGDITQDNTSWQPKVILYMPFPFKKKTDFFFPGGCWQGTCFHRQVWGLLQVMQWRRNCYSEHVHKVYHKLTIANLFTFRIRGYSFQAIYLTFQEDLNSSTQVPHLILFHKLLWFHKLSDDAADLFLKRDMLPETVL